MDTAKDLLDKVSSIKNSSGDIGYEKNRATADGALLGAAIGLFLGFVKKQNMIVWGMMGAVGGAIIARVLMPKE